jgi:spore coat polysaccharide biosynthesis protein SpsF
MYTLAIIQARVGSRRLPGKVLAEVAGRPLLWYVVRRAQLALRVDQVVVAIPDTTEDLAIADLCAAWDVPCVTGPEHDVLARYQLILERWQPRPDLVVRITADCPLIDPDVIDATIGALEPDKIWASNVRRRTWPDGLDVEVLRPTTLRWLADFAREPGDREHVTPRLYREVSCWNAGSFYEAPLNMGHLRWTVDVQVDLDWVRQVYTALPWDARWAAVLLQSGGLGLRSAA